jgi:hypothetical protein
MADRIEIEALRGECTEDGVVRVSHIGAEAQGREALRAGVERLQRLWEYLVQTTHPGTIQLQGDTAVGRAYISELMRSRDGRSEQNYGVCHDRYQRTEDGGKFAERVCEIKYLDHPELSGSAPHTS